MKNYLIEKRYKELCENGRLTNEQNTLLTDEYNQDRKNGLDLEESIARTLLILGNQKLIYHVLKTRFSALDMYDEDVVSVGRVALVKAVDTYDKEKNIEFSSYAVGCINYEILNYYRKLRAKGHMPDQQIFLGDSIIEGVDEDGSLSIIDTIADDEDFTRTMQNKCLFEQVAKNMKYLSRKEALTVIFMNGLFDYPKLTQVETAEKLKVSRTSIATYYSYGIKKLKVLTFSEKDLNAREMQLKQRLLTQGSQNNLVVEQCE